MHRILDSITNGSATEEDLENLEGLCRMVGETSLCGLGQTAPNPVLSTLRYFRDEYEAHIHDRVCPAGVCDMTQRPIADMLSFQEVS
jgi:bidirectional [NiFe] hydrogenase diaphorase subunit